MVKARRVTTLIPDEAPLLLLNFSLDIELTLTLLILIHCSGGFRGARGAVAPSNAISGHTKGWMYCYKNTLILANSVIWCPKRLHTPHPLVLFG